ncbi:TIGR04282 family arsenosugar biosynthesis glycosyltransferase [Gaetbulibacter aestuarii]|uniref:TIGR04282 family arsenosugar biosynthesis glycosyltransferase n=1 Tax=Gaetbulibacter aestuarii TaxID=1502358 RepID=A0ABW7MWB9_9FLAO
MTKDLIIVFVKNAVPGRVKTRLAKSIGDQAAFEVYESLVNLTKDTLVRLKHDKQVYFSETLESRGWKGFEKHVQEGSDLGERMHKGFQKGFQDGYQRIILIGSDLPDINAKLIKKALEALNQNTLVFGPAHDGGYYLIGMSELQSQVFKNKAWSTSTLLESTLQELDNKNITYGLLETLNDIDTFEDLKKSSFYKSNNILRQKIEQHYGEDH